MLSRQLRQNVEKGADMWSNLRAAQALAEERLATAARGGPSLRIADRIPDWITSPINRLSAVHHSRMHSHKRHRIRPAA
jgi:hypothetical protein